MTRIALVVSDVDGTLVTNDKRLTESARQAVARLHDRGIGFTITSSRPPFGMRMLIGPLHIKLPIGPFNGSSIVDTLLNPIEQHVISADVTLQCLGILAEFKIDAWLFTNDRWIVQRDDGKYVPHEKNTIKTEPTYARDFRSFWSSACKIVGASADAARLEECEIAIKKAVGDRASAVRSQSYYLDITPPGKDKGTFVDAISQRLNIPLLQIATIGDMQNDLAMFRKSGMSVAMGNATDAVKKQASEVTASNEDEGFAGAIDIILNANR